jgi:predicted acetyltransferase
MSEYLRDVLGAGNSSSAQPQGLVADVGPDIPGGEGANKGFWRKQLKDRFMRFAKMYGNALFDVELENIGRVSGHGKIIDAVAPNVALIRIEGHPILGDIDLPIPSTQFEVVDAIIPDEDYERIAKATKAALNKKDSSKTTEPEPEPNADSITGTVEDLLALPANENTRNLDNKTVKEIVDLLENTDYGKLKVRNVSIVKSDGYPDDVFVNGEILDENDNKVGYFFRRITKNKDGSYSAGHTSLNIEEESRGTGFGTKFSKLSEAMYKKLGISKIEITAADENGAYTWAKAGYDWNGKPSVVISSIRKMLGEAWKYDPDQMEALKGILERFDNNEPGSPNYPTPKEIADLPIGKEVLNSNVEWEGLKRLDVEPEKPAQGEKKELSTWDRLELRKLKLYVKDILDDPEVAKIFETEDIDNIDNVLEEKGFYRKQKIVDSGGKEIADAENKYSKIDPNLDVESTKNSAATNATLPGSKLGAVGYVNAQDVLDLDKENFTYNKDLVEAQKKEIAENGFTSPVTLIYDKGEGKYLFKDPEMDTSRLLAARDMRPRRYAPVVVEIDGESYHPLLGSSIRTPEEFIPEDLEYTYSDISGIPDLPIPERTQDEKDAISMYRGWGYMELKNFMEDKYNTASRSQEEQAELQKHIDNLDQLTSTEPLPKGTVLYRGLDLGAMGEDAADWEEYLSNLKPGDRLTSPGWFTSTTLDQVKAEEFATLGSNKDRTNSAVVMKITTKDGATGTPFEFDNTVFGLEKEVLLPMMPKFTVTNVYRDSDGILRIDLDYGQAKETTSKEVEKPVESVEDIFAVEDNKKILSIFEEKLGNRKIGDFDVRVTTGRKITKTINGKDIDVVEFSGVVEQDDNIIGRFSRYIYKNQDGTYSVVHDGISLKPEYRGKGFGTEFGKLSEEVYKDLGISKIELTAGEQSGSYAWAKAGFQWKTEPKNVISNIDYNINILTQPGSSFPEKDKEDILKVLRNIKAKFESSKFGDNDYPTPLDVANLKTGDYNLGKWILSEEIRWDGFKDLTEEPKVDTADQPLDFSNFEKVSGNLGSNPGGIYKDPKTGKQYYVKIQAKERGDNERLASALYREARIDALEVKEGVIDEFPVTYRDWVESGLTSYMDKIRDGSSGLVSDSAHDGFAVDAWLANWDVVGLGLDNLSFDKDNKPVRIDSGGSLLYRAQGKRKGAEFGDTVPEIESLKDETKNMATSVVFEDITPEAENESIDRVENITPERIDELVDQYISDPNDNRELKKKLKARRQYLIDYKNKLTDSTEENAPSVQSILDDIEKNPEKYSVPTETEEKSSELLIPGEEDGIDYIFNGKDYHFTPDELRKARWYASSGEAGARDVTEEEGKEHNRRMRALTEYMSKLSGGSYTSYKVSPTEFVDDMEKRTGDKIEIKELRHSAPPARFDEIEKNGIKPKITDKVGTDNYTKTRYGVFLANGYTSGEAGDGADIFRISVPKDELRIDPYTRNGDNLYVERTIKPGELEHLGHLPVVDGPPGSLNENNLHNGQSSKCTICHPELASKESSDSTPEASTTDWEPKEGLTTGKGESRLLDAFVDGDYLDIDSVDDGEVPRNFEQSDIPSDQHAALQAYASTQFRNFNNLLRYGPEDMSPEKVEDVKEKIANLDELIDTYGDISRGTYVFRGMTDLGKFEDKDVTMTDLLESLNPGDVFSDPGFMSTSSNKDIALRSFGPGLGAGDGAIKASEPSMRNTSFWVINLPAGSKALGVPRAGYGYASLEDEVVLPRGSELKIVGIRKVPHIDEDGEENGFFNYFVEAELQPKGKPEALTGLDEKEEADSRAISAYGRKMDPIDVRSGTPALQDILETAVEAARQAGWDTPQEIDEEGNIISDPQSDAAKDLEFRDKYAAWFVQGWPSSFEYVSDTNAAFKELLQGDTEINPKDITKLPSKTREIIAGLELIQASPEINESLFRGIRTNQATLDSYQPGATIELPFSSFSVVRSAAEQYWEMRRSDIAGGGIAVEYELEPGSRSLPLIAFDPQAIPGEFVSAGRYEVVSVEKSDDPDVPTKVKIRHVGTFDPMLQREAPTEAEPEKPEVEKAVESKTLRTTDGSSEEFWKTDKTPGELKSEVATETAKSMLDNGISIEQLDALNQSLVSTYDTGTNDPYVTEWEGSVPFGQIMVTDGAIGFVPLARALRRFPLNDADIKAMSSTGDFNFTTEDVRKILEKANSSEDAVTEFKLYKELTEFERATMAASTLITDWATSSNGSNIRSLAIQDIAEVVFDTKNARDWNSAPKTKAEVEKIKQEYGGVLSAFLQAQYEQTQKRFKEAGVTEVVLYRGIDDASLGKTLSDDKLTEVDVQSRPLSSWSTSDGHAYWFATGGYDSEATGIDKFNPEDDHKGAVLLRRVIPVEQILSNSFTGVGSYDEREMVVIGGEMKVEAVGAVKEDNLIQVMRNRELKDSVVKKDLKVQEDWDAQTGLETATKKKERIEPGFKNWYKKIKDIFTEADEDYDESRGNVLQSVFLEKSGFNDKPQVLSQEEFDAASGESIYRGFTSAEFMDDYITSDTPFAGEGYFGNGTYSTNKKETTFTYTGDDDSNREDRIMEMKLMSDANVISFDEATDLREWATEKLQEFFRGYDKSGVTFEESQDAEWRLFNETDYTNIAIMLGIDAIRFKVPLTPDNEYYTIILNRGKVFINGKS